MTLHTTSASNIFRRALCPASHHLEAGVPEEDNDVSRMGTLGHAHFADKTLDRSGLTEDLQRCLRIGDEEEATFYAAVENDESIPAGEEFEMIYERGLWFVDAYGQKLFPGHCDGWRYYPRLRVLAIPDLKLGYLPVDGAESNWQLASYGCMGRHLTQCSVFYGAIIQPRMPRSERLTIGRYDAASLDAVAVEIAGIYANAVDADGLIGMPAESQCRNCKGKLRCTAFIDRIRSLIPSLPPPVAKKNVEAKLVPLSDAAFSIIGDNLKFAAMIEDGWKAEAIARIQLGGLHDWEIIPGNVRKEVKDTLYAFQLLCETVPNLTEREYMMACKLSIAALKVPVAKHQNITQTKAEFLIKETLASVIEEKQNAPSVCRK